MSSAPTTVSCSTHRKRPSITTCSSCGAAVCKECMVPTSVGVKCTRCTGVKAAAARAGRADGPPSLLTRVKDGESPSWLFPAVVVGVLVVGMVAIGLLSGGDEPDADPVGRTAAEDYPRETTVQFSGADNVALTGTFTLPVSRQPVAGVLVVPGFGTIDRNQVMVGSTGGGPADRLAQEVNVAGSGATDPLYGDLSAALVNADLATLRYDKRGLGESRIEEGATISYDDVVADARAGLQFLSQRIELEGKPLVVLGYDQGAVTAMTLASEPGVAALVLVSPPGRGVVDVLSDHFARTHADQAAEVNGQLEALAASLVAGEPLPARDSLSGHLRPMFPEGSETYLAQVFAVDPVAEAAGVSVPTLVLRGEADANVTAADAQALLGALPPGSEEQVAPAGDHNLASEGVRAREYLTGFVSWVTSRVGG